MDQPLNHTNQIIASRWNLEIEDQFKVFVNELFRFCYHGSNPNNLDLTLVENENSQNAAIMHILGYILIGITDFVLKGYITPLQVAGIGNNQIRHLLMLFRGLMKDKNFSSYNISKIYMLRAREFITNESSQEVYKKILSEYLRLDTDELLGLNITVDEALKDTHSLPRSTPDYIARKFIVAKWAMALSPYDDDLACAIFSDFIAMRYRRFLNTEGSFFEAIYNLEPQES